MQVHDMVVKCHVISVRLSLLTRGKWKDEADETNLESSTHKKYFLEELGLNEPCRGYVLVDVGTVYKNRFKTGKLKLPRTGG